MWPSSSSSLEGGNHTAIVECETPMCSVFPDVVYLEEPTRSPLQLLDSTTLCSLTGNALSLWDVETGQRSLVSFAEGNDAQVTGGSQIYLSQDLPSGEPAQSRNETKPDQRADATGTRQNASSAPAASSPVDQHRGSKPSVERRQTSSVNNDTGWRTENLIRVQLLPCFAACGNQSLVACVGRGEKGKHGYCSQVFLVRRQPPYNRNGEKEFHFKALLCAPESPLLGEVCALGFSACGRKLYCLSLSLAKKQDDLETFLPSPADLDGEPSRLANTQKEGVELLGKRGLITAVSITVFDTAACSEVTRTEIHVSGLGSTPRRLSVCRTNPNLIALWSRTSLSFVELLATGEKPTSAANVTEAIGEEAGFAIVDLTWFSLPLKRPEKDLCCCCVAASTGINFVFQLTEEKSVVAAKILWTFRTSSSVTCLLFSDPYLVTCHSDLSVLFSKRNTEFTTPFDPSGYPDDHKNSLLSRKSTLRLLTRQVAADGLQQPLLEATVARDALSSVLFLPSKKGVFDFFQRVNLANSAALDLPQTLDGGDQPQAGSKRLSQSDKSRKLSSMRPRGEGLDNGAAAIAHVKLETRLLGLSSHQPLVGLVTRHRRTGAPQLGLQVDTVTATCTGLIRTSMVQLVGLDNRPARSKSTCVPKSHISLPSRLSCLGSSEHAKLGWVVLAGSEKGVLRWLNLDEARLVRELRVAEGPVRGLTACPEGVEGAAASSLLWGALFDDDTLAFLRTTDESLSFSSANSKDFVVLGTVSLSTALGLHKKCPLGAVLLDCCPAALCVLDMGVYVGTSRGEVFCFDFPQLLGEQQDLSRGVGALLRSPPASPLYSLSVTNSPVRSLAVPSLVFAPVSASVSAPVSPPSSSLSSSFLPSSAVPAGPCGPLGDAVLLVATSMDGCAHAVRMPRRRRAEPNRGGSTASRVSEGREAIVSQAPHAASASDASRHLCRVLWTRDLRCSLASCGSSVFSSALAFASPAGEIHTLVATSMGRDGLLLWTPLVESGNEHSPDRSSPVAQSEAARLFCEVQRTSAIEYFQSDRQEETRSARGTGRRCLGSDDACVEIWRPVEPSVEKQLTWTRLGAEAVKEAQKTKEALEAEMKTIRDALNSLIRENETRSSLEALPREAFCIDVEVREKIAAEIEQERKKFRTRQHLQAVAFRALQDRFTEKFWKNMKRPGRAIASLAEKPEIVRDFPVAFPPVEQAMMERKVRFLRELEKREKKWLQSAAASDKSLLRMKVEDGVISMPWLERMQEEYITHAWTERDIHESPSGSGEASTAVEGTERPAGASDEGPFFEHVNKLRSLLYPALEVLSVSRRRMQSCLLNQVAAALRDAFNKIFDRVAAEKKRTVDQITQRVKMAHSLAEELKCEPGVAAYTFSPCEDPGALLKISKDDVLSELGFVPSWFTAREEDAARNEGNPDAGLDDASSRALKQMMDGHLKSKKDMSALEVKVERESWMSEVKPEDMTETQRKKVAEYEEKAAQLTALQEAYRKKQEGNLQRVKEEIRELKQKFHDKFNHLQAKRREIDAEILKEELSSIRHLVWVNSNIDRAASLDDLLRQLSLCSRQSRKTNDDLAQVTESCQALEKQHQNLQQADRDIVSSLRTTLHHAQLPPETYNALMGIFKHRRKQSQALPSASSPSEAPAADLKKQASFHVGAGMPSDLAEDVKSPDGVDETLFRKVLQAREDKRATENRLAASFASLERVRRYMSCMQQRQQRDASVEAALVEKISEERHALEMLELDVKLLVEIKQGHIEVTSPTPVTTYEGACVVHKEAIERCNKTILAIGKQKIDTLEMIKEFRRKIVMLDWEKTVLDAEAREVEERTKDVHMFRVTKEIQNYLAASAHQSEKSPQEGRAKDAMPKDSTDSPLAENSGAKIADQLYTPQSDHPGAVHRNSQLDALDKKIRELQQDIKKKTSENAVLKKLASDLQQNVAYGQKIRQLRERPPGQPPRDGSPIAGAMDARGLNHQFTSLQYVRRLQHAARRHTDEIDKLREELNRLRERSVPMFEGG
uniref:Cilia- and flagella-associated protein 43 n=1 Tax=Neospora caninum (strain Liverpool) TaxID=572307 RepID=A0A0F7UMJ0_NEOCL|nr:TPA: hypothetical protein BN1204_068070 [Neospora caninum Liverpool]